MAAAPNRYRVDAEDRIQILSAARLETLPLLSPLGRVLLAVERLVHDPHRAAP